MKLRIDRRIPLPANVRRIAAGHLDCAIHTLAHPADLDASVHDARKRLKRLRALIRLVHDDMGGDVFALENRSYRDAGRLVAGLRDSRVMLRTLEKVLSGAGEGLSPAAFEPVRCGLRERYERMIREHLDREAVVGAVTIMRAARARVDGWPLTGDGFDAIRPGLARIYRQGRRAMNAARHDPSTANLHAWRKQAEYFRFQMDILGPLWKPVIGAYAGSLKTLTDIIGDDHNLAILTAGIGEYAGAPDDPFFAALNADIARRRARLRKRAFRIGALVYAERPGALVTRMGGYWSMSCDR